MKRTAVALLIALLLLFSVGCANRNAYEDASALMGAGNYQEALAAFEALAADEYKDSADQALECRYQLAMQVYQSKDLSGAEQAMLELGAYKDAAAIAAECRTELDNAAAYDAAKALMQSDPAAARDALLALGAYRDCVLLADICTNYMGYPIEYDGTTYDVSPLLLSTNEAGLVTLSVKVSGYIELSFGTSNPIVLKISPAAASVYVGGVEIAYDSCDFTSDNECVYTFNTTGAVEKVELYPNLGGTANAERYEIDPATLVPAA